MDITEKVIYSNSLGTVTDQRLTLHYASGTEEIPIGEISAVHFKHRRYYFIAGISFSVGLVLIPGTILYVQASGGSKAILLIIISLLGLLSGIANWIGDYDVVICTGNQQRKPLKVDRPQVHAGRELVGAAQDALLR